MKVRLQKYEYAFAEQCRKLKLHLVDDEDWCPIVRAKGKKLKKMLILCPWKKTHFAVIILAPTMKSKNKYLRILQDTGAEQNVFLEGETEAIVFVKNEDMSKIVRPLKFIRSRNLTEEQRKAIGERLAKAREDKNHV